MRFLVLMLLIIIGFSNQVNACKTINNPDVKIMRSADDYDQCTDIVMEFPKKIGTHSLSSNPTIIVKEDNEYSVVVKTNSYQYFDPPPEKKDKRLSYFCLGEEALKESKIIIEYTTITPPEKIIPCMVKIEIDNLAELLTESDKEAAEKSAP